MGFKLTLHGLELLPLQLATLRCLRMFVLRLVLLLFARSHLVLHHFHLVLEAGQRLLGLQVIHAHSNKLPFCLLNLSIEFSVLGFDLLVEALPLLHLLLLRLLPLHVPSVLLAQLLELLVAAGHVVHGVLPLLDELFSIVVELLEKLCRFVHLDLLGLRLRHEVRQFFLLGRVFDCQFFRGEGEFSHFRVVRSLVLFEGQFVFFLLLGCDSPLFQLLLIPIHLQFELVELLVATQKLVGVAVDLVLGIVQDLLQTHDLGLKAPELAASQGLQMLLGVDFMPLGVDELLCVDQLLLDVDEMVSENLNPGTDSLDLVLHAFQLGLLSFHLGIQLPVCLRSERGQGVPV
mmetsp:Transcript_71485/g.149444  ORF Transcript_71485/g.149444 Transcript_71485/m.149444 type:complete len:346 (-) Transcript_71485:223-1260(-)